jgi:hypothetical protein
MRGVYRRARQHVTVDIETGTTGVQIVTSR